MTTRLSHCVVKVKLRISTPSDRKYDPLVSQEVARNKHAVHNAGRYMKKIMDSPALADYRRVTQQARQFHYFHTLPWEDGGWRLLNVDNIENWQAGLHILQEDAKKYSKRFLKSLDATIERDRERLGKLFNESDYPSSVELEHRFGIFTDLEPLANTTDNWVLNLSDELINEFRSDYEARTQNQLTASMNAVFERVQETLEHIAERLSSEGKTFRNSLINNVSELVEILPMLNVTDDPNLNQLTQDLRFKFAKLDPDVLRESPHQRKKAADEAQEILSKIPSLMRHSETLTKQAASNL